jgi:hypothetical protein
MTQSDHSGRSTALEPLKRLGRRIGLDHAFDAVWRHPVRDLRALARDGGPFERRKTAAGHIAMREAARTLPPLSPPGTDRGYRVHILTGERFWHQSIYCAASLQIASEDRITAVFYSDGTLDDSIKALLGRVLPWAEFVDSAAIDARLDAVLPASKFPTLRSRRKEYIHLRKLTDIHAFPGEWRLVMDSDLLFFRTPSALLAWFQKPDLMCMRDVKDNYGYPSEYLDQLAGSKLPARFNVGLYGIDSSMIDWNQVEAWCARQLTDFGPSYLQEQGLTAMLAAGRDVHVLPENDYLLMPAAREGRAQRAVMHHYVDHSKRSYFQYGWRAIDARIRAKSAGAGAREDLMLQRSGLSHGQQASQGS